MKFKKALENLESRKVKIISEVYAVSEFANTSTYDVQGLPLKKGKIVRRKIRVPITNIGSITL